YIGVGVSSLAWLFAIIAQLFLRPRLAWADRFKVEFVESAEPQRSWFYDALMASRVFAWVRAHVHGCLESIEVRTQNYGRVANETKTVSAAPGVSAWMLRVG